MKRLRILFITAEYSDECCGGAGVYSYELVKILSTMGVYVHVLTAGRTRKKTHIGKNLIVEHVPTPFFPVIRTPIFLYNIRKVAGKIIKQENISLIHSNNTAAAWISSTTPLIITVQHPALMENQNYLFFQKILNIPDIIHEKKLVFQAKAVVSTSKESRINIQNIYGHDLPELDLIPIGIDTEFFKPTNIEKIDIRKKYNIDKNNFVFFVPGAARGRRKGLEYLLPAIYKLRKLPFHCLISGNSRELGWGKYLENKLAEFKIENKITFCGELDYSELPHYYSQSDMSIFPSIFEGFGLPTLESLSCGCPVISTDTGEASNIIKDELNGHLVPVKDSEAITHQMEKVISNPEIIIKLSKNARNSVIKKYGWNNIYKQYIKLYEDIAQA